MVKMACETDICSAESGGSHGCSSKRCGDGPPDFLAERSVVGSHLSSSASTPTIAQQLNPDGVAPAAPPHFWHRRSILRAARGIRGAAHFDLTGLLVDKGVNATRVASVIHQRKSLGVWN